MLRFDFRWGEIGLNDQPSWTDFGSVRVWLRRPVREFAIAYRYLESADDEEVKSKEPKEYTVSESDWLRWAVESDNRKVNIVPILPDLPVVVRPNAVFRVARGVTAKIFVRVPVWINIEFDTSGSESFSHQVPSRSAVKAWSGSSTEGELCYWVSTSARREVREEMFRKHLAICPVNITNESSDELLVERLTLRVPHLSLFLAEDQLWSDETQVFFQGGGKVSRVDVTGVPPAEAEDAESVASPRQAVLESFSARTFSRIKDLPGFGLIS